MSIEAMRAVWAHSKTRGNARMVLTLIANSANPQGWDSYQFQTTLAEAANIGIRTVERAIEEATRLKELEVHRPDRTKQNRYSIMLPGLAIFDDVEERERRDATYEVLGLGRAAKTEKNRANRRSEDPTVLTGPSAEGPDTADGCAPDTPDGSGPDTADGCDPTVLTGLKEETSLNPNETPVKALAQAVEELWSLYPHHRRELDPIRTMDVLGRLGVDDVAGVERVTLALREDLVSKDWLEDFIPKLSAWLTDRKWDRPLADVLALNPLVGIQLADPDPELERRFRRDVGDEGWERRLVHCWHGRRGDVYILGDPRDVSWIEKRYGRVLNRILTDLNYAGLELVNAQPPQINEENAA